MKLPTALGVFLLPIVFSASNRKISQRSILTMSNNHQFVLDAFGARQFNNPDYTGTQVSFSEVEFERLVNKAYTDGAKLVDGYAPFCKHLFIPNFVGSSLKCGYTEITAENKDLIESCYEARKENELAVLIQYIDRKKLEPPAATFLDIILYSREQIRKENVATGDATADTDAPWGIISVKGQLCDFELPMQPITIMRNALGIEEGGSGVPLDRQKYLESTAFWVKNVSIK